MNITIKEMQKIIFNILCDIDDYCQNNNIQYFLSGGTCLGAVRHNGFIPWDDDADIMIPRYDFDCFMEGFATANAKKYGVGSLKHDPEWKLPYGRVWDLSTEAHNKNLNIRSIGIFVDIFPIDGLPDGFEAQKKMYVKIKKYNVMRHAAMRLHFQRKEKWKVIKLLLGVYCHRKGARYYAEKMEEEALKYKFEDAEYVAVSMACHYGDRETIHKECMSQAAQLVFNGRNFPVPKGYDTYLSNLYGDYMKIPKEMEEKGYTHLENWEVSLNKEESKD